LGGLLIGLLGGRVRRLLRSRTGEREYNQTDCGQAARAA
jgi:hypothetical protein